MAVRLRLRRLGRKKRPMYHIVAADSRVARNGKFLEVLGSYEPLNNPLSVTTRDSRIMYWLNTGAQPSDTVRSLLSRTGLWLRWTLLKKGMDEAAIATEMEKFEMAKAEKRDRDEARKIRRAESRRNAKKAAETPAA